MASIQTLEPHLASSVEPRPPFPRVEAAVLAKELEISLAPIKRFWLGNFERLERRTGDGILQGLTRLGVVLPDGLEEQWLHQPIRLCTAEIVDYAGVSKRQAQRVLTADWYNVRPAVVEKLLRCLDETKDCRVADLRKAFDMYRATLPPSFTLDVLAKLAGVSESLADNALHPERCQRSSYLAVMDVLDAYVIIDPEDAAYLRRVWLDLKPATPRDLAIERAAHDLNMLRLPVRAVLNGGKHVLDPITAGLVLDRLRREPISDQRFPTLYRRWWTNPLTQAYIGQLDRVTSLDDVPEHWCRRGLTLDTVEQWRAMSAVDFRQLPVAAEATPPAPALVLAGPQFRGHTTG